MCFLWHCPAGFPGSALPTTSPFDVRTFLEDRGPRDCSIRQVKVAGCEATVIFNAQITSDLPKRLGMSMYDVVYIDAQGAETPVAQQLDDRKDAA